MPADILREPATDTLPTPGPSDAAASFPDLSSSILDAYRRRKEQGEKVSAAMEAKSAGMAPATEDVRGAINAPRPDVPPPPVLRPPPSQGLRAFLMPRDNQPPEATISQLLSAITVFASGAGGLAKGSAREGLAAFTGALQGWKEGDRERADRAFKDWRAKTDTALEQWHVERAAYHDIMEATNLDIEQKFKLATLKAGEFDNKIALEAFRSGELDKGLSFLTQQQTHQDALAQKAATLAQMHADKVADREMRERIAMMQAESRLEVTKLRQEIAQTQQDNALKAYTPETLTSLGQQWAMDPNGKMPVGAPRGKVGEMIRPKIVAAGLEWLKSQGIDPMTLPQVRAEMGATRAALTKVTSQNAVMKGSITRFDGHLDQLLALSAKVPRSEMPAVNEAIIKGQRDYLGSPEAAAYVTQAFEVAMEFSRVMVGTAQGDASTREEARKSINTALNPDQLKMVAETLRNNAHRNLEINRANEKGLLDIIEHVGQPSSAGATGGKIRVKRKSDGQTGTLDSEAEFDAAKYERVN